MADGRERRRSERYDARLFTQLLSPTLKDDIGRGVVLDVSLSGFSIETESDLDLNQEMECHIEIPLNLRAKVVRRLPSGQMKRYGLIITRQGFWDKLILRKLLKGSLKTKKI